MVLPVKYAWSCYYDTIPYLPYIWECMILLTHPCCFLVLLVLHGAPWCSPSNMFHGASCQICMIMLLW
jgi:hypothetical protein